MLPGTEDFYSCLADKKATGGPCQEKMYLSIYMRAAKVQISLRTAQADLALRCPLTESLNFTDCVNGVQTP